jgi:hypothetical protein
LQPTQRPRPSFTTASATPPTNLSLAFRCSAALALVSGVAAAAGALAPSVFHDAPVTIGNARGTAIVTLVVALPTLVSAMVLASRGSMRASIVWLGALGYLAYNAVIYSFGVVFNALFLLYVASLSLSVWSIVTLARGIDAGEVAARFTPHLPARSIAAYLLLTTIAFAGLWLADVVPGMVTNGVPASLHGTRFITNPIQVLDFSCTLPLSALAGVWLWRRRPLGYLLAGVLLVALTIESASIATDQWFGHRSDPTQPLGTVPMFVVLTLVGLVPTILYLRNLSERGSPVVTG